MSKTTLCGRGVLCQQLKPNQKVGLTMNEKLELIQDLEIELLQNRIERAETFTVALIFILAMWIFGITLYLYWKPNLKTERDQS